MRPVLLLVLALVLAGCGFHPRGTLAVADTLGPVQVVTADPYSPLADGLARALERAGAQAATAGAPASTLRVVGEQMTTEPLAVDALAQVREYVTRYRVEFELVDAAGKSLMARQELTLEREYTYDSLASAGSPAEQELVQRELRRDMQAAILRRLDVALRVR